MQVDLITDGASFARLRPAWDALAACGGAPGPFTGFVWQYEWWGALGGGRALRLLVAHDAAGTAGILPLFEERRAGLRRLAFVGSAGGGSDYLDAPCRDESARARLLAAVPELGADLVELEDVEARSPLLPAAQALARATGRPAFVEPRYPCPYIPVRGDFASYLAAHPRRENLRRREKWLASQPGFRVDVERDPEAVPGFLARFYRLHAARWSADGGSQAFSDPRLVAFHSRVALRMAEEGRLHLYSLRVAGDTVAVVWAFDDARRVCFYQSGFAPAWGARSPGLVLFARFVEDSFRRGVEEIDLLRGAEPYKTEWAREARATVALRWPLTARGRAWLAARRAASQARGSVRRALPEGLRGALARRVREARMSAGLG